MGEYFIRRPVFAISMAIAMTLMGIVALFDLSIEQYPQITPPVVQVTASYVGADALTVNNSVATPLAEGVMGVNDMLYMQTTSASDGTMNMQVTFDIGSSPDMDAIFTQNNVASSTSQLPQAVVEQGVTTRKSDTGFLMVYSLASDGRYDDVFLSNYASINMQDRLAKINGVGKVEIMGAGEYAMRIWIKPDRLHYYSLSLDEVVAAVRTQSALYPVGKFGAEPVAQDVVYTYTAILPPQISTAEEFGEIIVALSSSGEEVRLSDVADVELGSEAYNVKSLFGEQPSTMIVIYQSPGSNAVNVGDKVKSEIASLKERFPDGVEIYTIVDSTANIQGGVKDIITTLIIALVLVIVIIYLFLQNWRATLIPLIAIPVSLIGAFMVFPLLGFSLNVISLLGMVLAIGLVVDDAIVVVEAVQANIETGMEAREATINAMRKVSSPIIATTIVLLAVFIPVSFTGGITGLLFQQFAITIAVAIVFSAINALTLSPALASLLLRPQRKAARGLFARFNSWFDGMMKRYDSFTSTLITHATRTALFVAAMLVVVVLVWRMLPSGFLPEEDQGYVMVMVSTPEASSLETTLQAMQHTEQIVAARGDVQYTALAAGFNMMAGISSTSSGIIFAMLKDFSDRKFSAMQIAAQLTEELYVAVPEAECYAFIPPSIPGLGTTSGITLEVQDLEGRGTAYLWEQTSRLMEALRKDATIASVSTQFSADTPQRKIEIRKRQAMSEGVELREIYNVLSTYLGGDYVGQFNRFGRLYQTYVQAAADRRIDEKSLNSYFVTNGKGESVPLAAFVEVKDTVGVDYITQFNLYESISLTVTPSAKSSTGDTMKQIARIAGETLPDDVGYAWSGTSYQEATASRSGVMVYLLALAFVFLALAALYNSWGLPLAILMSVPVAVVGALVATVGAHLVNANYVNNVFMQISIVMLIGLAAKNAILVVEYADTTYHSSPNISLKEAAMVAARERVRPIIMTAFAFILGVMPLIFASGIYSTARNIMGVALVGGMLLATLVGIFLYPAAFLLVAKWGGAERGKSAMMVAVVVASLLGSCAAPLDKAEVDVPQSYLFRDAVVESGEELQGEWWQMYDDPMLDSLICHALARNRNLAAAASKIESARYALSQARAEFLPELGAEARGEVNGARKEREYEFALQPTVSWNVSLFGALRHTRREAQANILSTEWAYRGVQLSLTNEVAKAYFTLRQYSQSLEIASHSLMLRREQAHLVEKMSEQGFSTGLDLEQARSLVYSAEADVAQYRRAVVQSKLSLATLLGETPDVELAVNDSLSVEALPQGIEVGLPITLLTRRPDIMESYYELQAAAARVGVAHSNRFPSLSITGEGGVMSNSVKNLFAQGYWAWGASAGVAQTLFSFGRLKRAEQIARSAYEEAVLGYEQQVLEALEEVESALIAISTYKEQIAHYEEFVASNHRIARLTRALYERGLDDYLDVISTEQSWYESQLELVGLVAQQYINYAALAMALGDWQQMELQNEK